MKVSIEQALLQAIEAHKVGKLQEAERLYRAILRSKPSHPDANHNLGVLAVSLNQAEVSLPLFRAAIAANPKIEQFWFSLIDALIKTSQFENAKSTIEEAKKLGVDAKKLEMMFLRAGALEENQTPPQKQLDKLEAQIERGDYSNAEKAALSLTEAFPNHPFGWMALGAILKQLGKFDESLAAMQRSVELAPQDAEAHVNLGITLLRVGRFSEAAASCNQAIIVSPQHSRAHYNLGITLKEMGRSDEAVTSFEKAIALEPDLAEVYSDLGQTLKALGRIEEAEAYFKQATAIKPDLAEALSNLGNSLQEQGEFKRAEDFYDQAIALKPDFPEAHFNLGNSLYKRGEFKKAEASYKRAKEIKPDYAGAHNNLGVILQEQGHLNEAKASFQQALESKPDLAEAHRHLASMKTFRAGDAQLRAMLQLYQDNTITKDERCQINFAIAKAYDDLEDFEKAFFHYCEANKLRKSQLKYDIDIDAERFEKIKSNFLKLEVTESESDNSFEYPTPIFIVGMPRSGTTLVEQIISSHPLVTGAGELPFIERYVQEFAFGLIEGNSHALQTFRNQYLEKLKEISHDKLFVTDKMPQNFRFIGLLAAAFPEAKIVHVKRNPAAVCWSNYKQFFASTGLGYSYSIDDVAEYYKLYEDLMTFWRESLRERIYDLDYESLTLNQALETQYLIDHLGLTWDEICLSPHRNMRSIDTASSLQVRKAMYQGSSGQWKNYEPFLNGAFDSL